MNRANIRSILRNWLAESSSSDFFTEDKMNEAISFEYRQFCAESGTGPLAEFAETGDGVTRDWVLPSSLVEIRRVDYGTDRQEVHFLPMEDFSVAFGDTYISEATVGIPSAYTILGGYSIRFHPIPSDTVGFKITGTFVPDELTNDVDELMLSHADCFAVSKRAYVWMVERDAQRKGSLPPNYDRIKAEAMMETRKGISRGTSKPGGVRTVGGSPRAGTIRDIAQYGPRLDWRG